MPHRFAGNISITLRRAATVVYRVWFVSLCVCVCLCECAQWCVPIIATETGFLPPSSIFKRLAGNDMSTHNKTHLCLKHTYTHTHTQKHSGKQMDLDWQWDSN